MDEIRWEEPPAPDRIGNRWLWAERLKPLMLHPKRWAIVATYSQRTGSYQAADNLRRRHVRYPAGRWEFLHRSIDGEHRVYARYLGPDEDGAP